MLLDYLIDVYKSFYLVYLLILVCPLCFTDCIAEVTGRGISLGEPVLLDGCFIVSIPLGVTYTLAESPLGRALICKSNSFSKLVCEEV